jgi:deoxycytidylate deaminase
VSSSNTSCHHPQRHAHAEARLVKKLDQGSVVYVVRILSNGTLANAKPCVNCQKVLRRRGIRRISYSIGPSHYGVIDF